MHASSEEVLRLKIIRTIFQEPESTANGLQFILVLDMEEAAELSTRDIPNLIHKMETALPGIFPDENSKFVHNCGGHRSADDEHSFRDELEKGTSIPHLYEHILLHLLSRRSCACSAFCGQRSIDVERGIKTHYYLVLDCPSKVEAIVASELGFHLIQSWVEGSPAMIDPEAVFAGINEMLGPMLSLEAS